MRSSYWSSDVCPSDLAAGDSAGFFAAAVGAVAPAAELEERGAGLRLFRRGAGAVARAGTSSGMVRRAGEMGACDGGVGQSATRPAAGNETARELGSASCRESVCQYGLDSGVADLI